MSSRKARKNRTYSLPEKMSAIQKHLVENVPVTQLCKEMGINPGVYYGWQKMLFERGTIETKVNSSNQDRRIKALEKQLKAAKDKINQKNEVISELMEEHITLKKKSHGGI